MQVDYLITGQGICGTLLSYHLLKEGAEVMVIDDGASFTASRVASGLINPVTGKRYVPSWMTEELMPVATDTYRALEETLDISLMRRCDVLNFFPTPQARDGFVNRIPETSYLQIAGNETLWREYFHFRYGVGLTSPCWLINLNLLLKTWRKRLSREAPAAGNDL